MAFHHIALANASQSAADAFYIDVLGLELIYSFTLPAEKAQAVFGLDRDIPVLLYGSGDFRAEVFIAPEAASPAPRVAHFCLNTPRCAAILERARAAGLPVVSLPRDKGGFVYFLRDGSGNLVELKHVVDEVSKSTQDG